MLGSVRAKKCKLRAINNCRQEVLPRGALSILLLLLLLFCFTVSSTEACSTLKIREITSQNLTELIPGNIFYITLLETTTASCIKANYSYSIAFLKQ